MPKTNTRTTLAAKDALEEDRNRADDLLMPTGNAIALQNVDKSFGQIVAIRDLTLTAPEGKITVLLGPNGAGKTTAIRLITGALTPDTGTLSVLGLEPTDETEGHELRSRCGVVTAKPSLYDRLSGRDNLHYAAELYGLGARQQASTRVHEAAGVFGIDNALDQKVGGYSTGMKTRLALARSILHRPDLLLLDEPTSGLDPESAMAVLGLVREMTADNKTVLMCTHLLLEAEGLADNIAIVEGGHCIVSGDPTDLAGSYWPNRTVELRSRSGSDLDRVRYLEGVLRYERTENAAQVEIADDLKVASIISHLTRDGVELEAVVPFQPSLEDLYLQIRRDPRFGSGAHAANTNELDDESLRRRPTVVQTGAQQRATTSQTDASAEALTESSVVGR